MTTAGRALDCRTSVLRANGRLAVCCEIDHFIPSGLSVPDLFTRLRPQLEVAIRDAAARDPGGAGAPRRPSVHMDVGSPDPGIALWVYSPAAAMSDLGVCFRSLEAIVTRFVAGEPPLGRHEGPLLWIADSLGTEDPAFVRVRSHVGLVGLDLEQALRRIDQFDEHGRERLLAGLAQHFDVDLGAAR